MACLKTLFLLLATLVATGLSGKDPPSKNLSYVITTDGSLIPGSEFAIDLHLYQVIASLSEGRTDSNVNESCILDIRVSADDIVHSRSTWGIELEDTPKSFRRTLKILVPIDDKKFGKTSKVAIESRSCLKFSRTLEIPVNHRELLISMRTDRLKYFPGEIVLIESLVLSQALLPHSKPVNLSIYNSENDLVMRWLNVRAEEGLIREQYRIPLFAEAEKLIIVLENHNQHDNHTLEVELPSAPQDEELFEVDVRCPRYVVQRSDGNETQHLNISVMASLFSGMPLLGNVKIRLSLNNEPYKGDMPLIELKSGYAFVAIAPKTVKDVLNIPETKSLIGQQVEVEVKVERQPRKLDVIKSVKVKDQEVGNTTTKGTNKTLTGDESKKGGEFQTEISVTRRLNVTFVNQSHVLFFTEHTPLFFKPGMSYVGQVLLRPLEMSSLLKPEEKSVTVKMRHHNSGSGEPREEEISVKVRANSIAEFLFDIPQDDLKIELEALFEDDKSGKVVRARLEEILPVKSFNGNNEKYMIQVLLDHKPPMISVNETLNATVKATFPISSFFYKVFSQSQCVIEGVYEVKDASEKHEFQLKIPKNVSHLLSSPRLLVGAITPNMEMIVDSVQFVVGQKRNKPLKVELMSATAEPGDSVEMIVRAEPFTSVYILSTSEPLVLDDEKMELRQILAREKMSNHLRSINSTHFSREIVEHCASCSTIPARSPDSNGVLKESRGFLLTDGIIFGDENKSRTNSYIKNGTLDDLEEWSFFSIEKFETRLWNLNVSIGSSGEEKLTFVVPAGARLYTIAAFGLVPGKGLAVAEEPVQLLSTSKLLASLEHVETAVRGEDVFLHVILFNNQDKETKVEVSVEKGDGFTLACLEEKNEDDLTFNVDLKPKQEKTLSIKVRLSSIVQESPKFKIRIRESDGVHMNLTSHIELKNQNIELSEIENILLDNFDGKHEVNIDLSARNAASHVPNSDRAVVKIYGHPLGPAIESVCRNINDPQILDEKTKLWFVLAANVIEHISNNSLFEKPSRAVAGGRNSPFNVSHWELSDRDECIKSAREAIIHSLHKMNQDGSVSIHSNFNGILWLTTLTLDAKVVLRNVEAVEEDVVKIIRWLTEQQQQDGSFAENPSVMVFRNNLGQVAGKVPLTSQVLISLLEAKSKLDLSGEISEKIETVSEKAVDYILKEMEEGKLDNDSYSLNVAAYALALKRNNKVFNVLEKRDKLVIHDGDQEYWSVVNRHHSLSVEATSYAILTSIALDDFHGSTGYANFLLGQMRSGGKFPTVLDTNVALRALSLYYRTFSNYHNHERVNVDVRITLSNGESLPVKILSPFLVSELHFENSNISLAKSLKIEASGSGHVLVQTLAMFNKVENDRKIETFDVKLNVTSKSSEHLELGICVENLDLRRNATFVAEVPVLTGYDLKADKSERSHHLHVLKQKEWAHVLFIEVRPSTSMCTSLDLKMISPVGNLRQKFVKVYPIDDKESFLHKSYPEEMEDTTIDGMCH